MDNKRLRNFIVIIYEDDENFDLQMFNLLQEDEVIYIRHDKDLTDEGELKKPHYHFVVKLKNPCTISALSKRINVNANMIEPIKKSFNGSLKYLIHFKDDFKHQYDPNEVKSNSEALKRRFDELVLDETPEVEKVISIQDYVDSHDGPITIGVLGRYVQKINKWDAFRRNMMYFCKIVEEHNSRYWFDGIEKDTW